VTSSGLQFYLFASPFAACGQVLQHQVAKLRIGVVALDVDIESIDLQNNIAPFEDGGSAARPLRNIDHQDAARLPFQSQKVQRSRILRWLPPKIEVAQTAVLAALPGV
jgi:hypothetical protein